jgi:heme-degrading monooxygenase HmoA
LGQAKVPKGDSHDGSHYPRQAQGGNVGFLRTHEVVANAGKIPGLKGRWLAHEVDNPDAGYTISLWENEEAMRAYEAGDQLQNAILPRLKPFFSGEYNTTRCEVRFAEEF